MQERGHNSVPNTLFLLFLCFSFSSLSTFKIAVLNFLSRKPSVCAFIQGQFLGIYFAPFNRPMFPLFCIICKLCLKAGPLRGMSMAQSVRYLPSAWGMILGSLDRALHWVSAKWGFCFPPPSASFPLLMLMLSLSQKNK